MSELEEKKNRKIGWSVSIGVHLAVFLLFLFLLAWREPNPPYPEYGIEINFGLDDAGTGNIQPENEAADEEETKEPSIEETTKQVEDQPEMTGQSEEIPEVIENEDAPEMVEEKPVEKPVTTPVVKEEAKKDETKPVEKPATVAETAPKKETTQQTETSESTSQGDNASKTGDKGDPQGDLDSRALYGNKGGGDGGNSLELTGWDWGDKPKEDPYSETGRIIFKIAVDNNGEVIQVTTETSSVSPQVVNHYRNEIMKLTFNRVSTSAPPARSEGTLTIRLKKN